MSSPNPFANLTFEDFRRLAMDESLSKYAKIGFPDAYREGFEATIFTDIRGKLTNLDIKGGNILDIGPGCSDLPAMLIDLCRQQTHQLTLIDSAEMLDLLPDAPFIDKVAALYPICPDLLTEYAGRMNVILCYSVLHYVLVDTAFFRFLDTSLALLAPGGQMLIGDIPNVSKRNRFFASAAGVQFHQNFTRSNTQPELTLNQIAHDQIDDAVVFALLQRARAAGFDAYLLPQDPALPMANRREDILIVRP